MTFVITPRHKILNAEERVNLNEDLSKLGELSKRLDSNIYLVGGVGLALYNGEIYRNHHDFDIAVFKEEFSRFYENIGSLGYSIVSRKFSMNISHLHNMQCVSKTSLDDILQNNASILRAIKCSDKDLPKAYYAKSRVDYFDIFLLEQNGGYIRDMSSNTSFSENDFYPIKKVPVGDNNILVPNPSYRKSLECKKPKQTTDMIRCGLL